MEQDFYEKLAAAAGGGRVHKNEPLKNHTTFRIGGPADYFVRVCRERFAAVIALCRREGVPYFVIGNGSNLLVSDAGFRGVVLCLDRSEEMVFEDAGEYLTGSAGAGVLLSAFAMEAARRGAAGFEFAAGIPGSVGGAVFMNAGAYGGEIGDYLVSARVLNREGRIVTMRREELRFSYRSSILQREELFVLDAGFRFEKGDARAALGRIGELNAMRRAKQPLEYPSAGSTFKRPEGYFAGKLIMDAGLADFAVGGAKVSGKHCGFVINEKNATAKDVAAVIAAVQAAVLEKYGVRLETEIRLLGEF